MSVIASTNESEPAQKTFNSATEILETLEGGFRVGSRWYKGNLHVHARGMDATKLIEEAVAAGLDFIAVTDHQTFGYLEPVAKAAAAASRPITVFPGMEITTHEGVHLLAIFPVGLSTESRTKFLGFLEVSGSGDTNEASRRTVAEVFVKVDEEDGITVIAHAFASKTGLFDSARKISTKNEWLASGFVRLIQCPEDKIQYVGWNDNGQWTNRYVLASANHAQIEASTYCLAPINTSDCYSAAEIGKGCTWLRMGEVSIEGLKQVACEPAARIAKQEPPDDECHDSIVALRVTGGFCDHQTFLFNGGFDCIVGQNHAGKSAVFDFIRFALGLDDEGPPDARTVLLSRLDAILGAEGMVDLMFRHSGHSFLVKRLYRPELSVAGGVTKIVRVKDAAKYFRYDPKTGTLLPETSVTFPVEVYEQGRIHRLRDDVRRQLEMLDEFAGLQAVRNEHTELVAKLNASADGIAPIRTKLDKVTFDLAQLPVLKQELTEKQALIPKEEEQEPWSAADSAAASIKQATDAITTLSERIQIPQPASDFDEEDPIWRLFNQAVPIVDGSKIVHADLFERWRQVLQRAVSRIAKAGGEIAEAAKEVKTDSDVLSAQWEQYRDQRCAEVSRELAKAGVESPQELLSRVKALRIQISQLESDKASQATKLREDLKQKEDARQALLERLEDLDQQIRATRSAKSKELTEALGGLIKVDLTLFGDRAQYKKLLSELYSQISSKELKIKNIDAQLSLVADNLTPRQLAQALLNKGRVQGGDGIDVELIQSCGITSNTQTVLCAIASDIKLLNRLQTAPTPDVLKISVKRHGESVYADLSSGLSPGEQSAALLTLALQSRSIPLIIDQPEDELGYNYVVNLIVPRILKTKLQRQMLIITHNANVPVLGDADFVIKMENLPRAEGGRQCIVSQQGCFESTAIIATLLELEGGRRAFEFRQHRYSLSERN